MFAVIKTGGKQYRVAAEDIIEIERIAGDAGDIVTLTDILMVGEGASATIGAPFVDGASIAAEIVEQNRGPKVISFKKRRRQNSRRKKGHRQLLTTVRISEILTGGAKPSKTAAPKKEKPGKAAEEKAAKPETRADTKKTEAPAAAAPLFTAPSGDAEDLTKIKGIGPVAKKQLAEQGITQFAQVAALTDEEVVKIDDYMPFSADQIKDWREQAKEIVKKG